MTDQELQQAHLQICAHLQAAGWPVMGWKYARRRAFKPIIYRRDAHRLSNMPSEHLRAAARLQSNLADWLENGQGDTI